MTDPVIYNSTSEEETTIFAKDLVTDLKNTNVICLFGDLGAGKTVFVKGIAKAFGIDDYTVKSPTYTLVREYPHKKGTLIHVDLYRLNEPDEVLFKQLNEYASDKNNLILIEWAEKLTADALEKRGIDVCFEYLGRTTRKITVFK